MYPLIYSTVVGIRRHNNTNGIPLISNISLHNIKIVTAIPYIGLKGLIKNPSSLNFFVTAILYISSIAHPIKE
jgi:hypothetical protein